MNLRSLWTHGLRTTIIFLLPATAGAAAVVEVRPARETAPASPVGDADDICFWVHPNDPSLSVVIGTDKERGLDVYTPDGQQIQHVQHGRMNNVDIRYGFTVGGKKVDLLAASNKDESQSIALYAFDGESRKLIEIGARPLKPDMDPYGLCMYHSLVSGKFYVVVNSYSGGVEQWELFDNGQGKVDGKRVRKFEVGSRTEGCVCDDEYGHLYIGEENVGIWKYAAEPDVTRQPCVRRMVDALGPKGHLSDNLGNDIEGLTLYYLPDGNGYLIASCQGAATFSVYRREGENEFVGTFRIAADSAGRIDAVSDTDGIDVINVPLGTLFPTGVFVVHDGSNTEGDSTNYKYIAWDAVAEAFNPKLQVNTSWNPRRPQKRQ